VSQYTLLGVEASYYAAKIRVLLRYKRLAFEDRLATRAVFDDIILPKVGWAVIPVLLTPANEVVQDTSDMFDLIEARHPLPPAVPKDSSGRVLAYLLELLGDEWLKLPAMHYRWNYNYDFAVAEFGRNNDPEHTPAEQLRVGAKIARRFHAWLEPLGVWPASHAAIEHDYFRLLDLLEVHFAAHPYLQGGAPTLGDFAFYGPFYAHLYRDPAAGAILRARAPRVVDWIERLGAGARDAQGIADAVPESLIEIVRHLLRDYVPILCVAMPRLQAWLAANPDVVEMPRYCGEHDVVLGRGTKHEVQVTRAVFSYEQWMLQRVRDVAASVPAATRSQVVSMSRRCDAGPLFELHLATRVRRHAFKLVRE
jgi:glutathione S-transferase